MRFRHKKVCEVMSGFNALTGIFCFSIVAKHRKYPIEQVVTCLNALTGIFCFSISVDFVSSLKEAATVSMP